MTTESLRTRTTVDRPAMGDRLIPAALFCTFTLLALLCTNFPTWGWPGGDGRDYANITEALVEGHSFDLRHSTWPKRRDDDPTIITTDDGSLYSIFPIGKPLAQAPFFALGRWLTENSQSRLEKTLIDNLSFSMTSAVLYGLSGCLLFMLLFRYCEFSRPLALLGTFIYCLGTLAFPFSKIHGVESLQIVLLMAIIYSGLRPGKWSLAIMAFCFGWAVLAKPPSAVVLPTMVYLFFSNGLWSKSNWASRGIALLGGAAFAALFFYYNWLRSGDASAAYAVGHAADSTFTLMRIPATIWPLLFGPDRNLFLNNPALFLALPGFCLFRNKNYLITVLLMWVGMLTLYGASGNKNWGAYVGNGRYAVPYIFLLMPFVLATIERLLQLKLPARRFGACLIGAAVLLWSFYVQILYASYSEFHVKQFERLHNRIARKVDMPTLEEAKHQLVFTQALYWATQSCVHPRDMEHFNYPSPEPERARFAADVLKSFPEQYFCKDYLFLNKQAFSSVSWFESLRNWILVLFLLSVATLAGRSVMHRSHPDDRPRD